MSGKQFAFLMFGVTLLAGVTVAVISFAPLELSWALVIALGAAYLVRRGQK